MAQARLHATCIAIDGSTGPLGILLRGPSGAGKSDLALRMIDQGARLVADDQCALQRRNGAAGAYLVARAPAAIGGLLEVRGLGVVDVPTLPEARVAILVDLVAPEAVERMPEDAAEEVMGIAVPKLALDPFKDSAPAKLRLFLRTRSLPAPDQAKERGGEEDSASRGRPGSAPEANPRPLAPRPLVIVTGLSGAGNSTALKVLEDIGYEAVDNLPLGLLDTLVREGEAKPPLAVGVDIRTRNFAAQPLMEHLARFSAEPDLAVSLLFLDCEDAVLERRFTETRRRHPLAQDRPITDGIAAERRQIAPLRNRADRVIDTSALVPAELRRILVGHFSLDRTPGMTIFVTSFSYRHGLPRVADLVFDVRFLANPHYQTELRALDGRDPSVAAFVAGDASFAPFFDRLTGLLRPLMPRYEAEGKSYLTIAIGCTGGRHRSVAVAKKLADWFREQGRRVDETHRDLAAGPS